MVNKKVDFEDSWNQFPEVVPRVETKYECLDCDEIFYERSCKTLGGELVCPNCLNEDIKSTHNRVDSFWENR